jgi:transcriptional regulator with XRE-family HTH domain
MVECGEYPNACICQEESIRLSAFGDRLRQARAGLTQAEFGRMGGVQRNAQAKYEAGERSPDARYLASLAAAGVDVFYLLTGVLTEPAAAGLHDRSRGFDAAAPTANEIILLTEFRRLTEADRATVLKLVRTLARGG